MARSRIPRAPSVIGGRQSISNECTRISTATDCNHNVLLSVDHVGHWGTAFWSRHVDCAYLFAGHLVIGAQHGSAGVLSGCSDLRLTRDDESFGDQRPHQVTFLAGAGNVQAAQCWVVSHHIGCLAMRNLPCDFAFVEIDRGDGSVGRFHQRQPVDIELYVLTSSAFFRRRRGICPGILTRTMYRLDLFAGGSIYVSHVWNFLGRLYQPDGLHTRVAGIDVCNVALRIIRPSRPIGASGIGPQSERSQWPIGFANNGWCEHGAKAVLGGNRRRLLAELRREVDQVINGHAVATVCGRLAGDGLRRRVPFAGNIPDGYLLFRDGPNGLAGHPIEHVQKTLLAWLCYGFDRFTVNANIGQDGSRRDVHVPERVMHELEMPFSLSG